MLGIIILIAGVSLIFTSQVRLGITCYPVGSPLYTTVTNNNIDPYSDTLVDYCMTTEYSVTTIVQTTSVTTTLSGGGTVTLPPSTTTITSTKVVDNLHPIVTTITVGTTSWTTVTTIQGTSSTGSSDVMSGILPIGIPILLVGVGGVLILRSRKKI